MSWITAIWSAVAATCLTLAGVHFLVWLKSRDSSASLLFSISATSAAICAGFELVLMHAETPAQFGEVLRWYHVPLAVLVVSLIWFVRQHLQAGRLWLLWLFCGLRVVTLTLTFILDPNLNFREITGLHVISAWGETIVSPIGVKNPWTNITHASGVVLLVFIVDAAMEAWRKGQRRRGLLVGGTFVLAVLAALTFSELLDRGGAPIPFTLSLAFLIIILGMAYELSVDLLNANRIARELRENQERMNLATRAANLGIWDWDVANDVFWVTDTVRNRYGVGESEKVNVDRLLKSVNPEDRERIREALRQAIESGSFEAEYRILTAAGTIRWVAARGQMEHDARGHAVRLYGISIDITDRKLAEEKFRLVVEASPNALVVVSPDGLMRMVNIQTESIFGYTRAELIGQPIELLVPQRYRARHPSDRNHYFADPSARAMGAGRELFGLRKDGSEIPLEIGLNPIRTPEGLLVLASIVEVSARKRSEAELQTLQAELAHVQRVSTMGHLSTALAHELNQPLGAILSNAEAAEMLLDTNPASLDQVREILADIRKDDERAGEVIRRMRSLLRRQEMHMAPLDMGNLIREVLRLVSGDATLRKVTVRGQVEASPLPTRGDRVHLQQVLLNLIVNGMDAVAGKPSEERQVVVQASRNRDGEIEVAVSDNGPGIPAEQLPRLFEPFFTTKANGMGMGTSISRSIVQAHHGRIWAENNPDGGAIIRFTLPVDEGPESRQHTTVPRVEEPTPDKP